ncbi:MAG: intein-containing adenosylcobalamin-dependent ribonucleoside-diphosphate reductase, partial [Gammaproteobacteria bacterium]
TCWAPTGTISFAMDCDTTGIEPELALVKYKLLAGQGDAVIKIVNQSVPRALRTLGYDKEAVERIVAYVEEHGTVVGSPVLDESHYPVFATSFGSNNVLLWQAHVKMMAACQAFTSMAISKTVNLPENATVENIMEAYVLGWKLGLKALAIYRDGSKRSQPLTTKEKTGEGALDENAQPADRASVRKRLPDERPSITKKISLAGHEGYLHVGFYPDSGEPGEIFITMAKQGSFVSGMMDAFATAVSIGLQYGVPLETFERKFKHVQFEPRGFTGDPDIPVAQSIVDYIFRYLGRLMEHRGQSGARTIELPGDGVEQPADRVLVSAGAEGPPCPNCGDITVRAGSCHTCPQCGTSTGCG